MMQNGNIERSPGRTGKPFWNLDRIMWLIIGLGLGAGMVWLLRLLQNVLLPFFAACLVAYLLNPVVEFLQRKCRWRRRLPAVIVTLLCLTAILVGLFYLFMPMIADEVQSMSTLVKRYAAHPDLNRLLPFVPDSWQYYLRNLRPDRITQLLDMQHLTAIFNKGTWLLAAGVDSIMHVLEWLLMFIYIIFVLVDYNQIVGGFKKIFPRKIRPAAMAVVGDVERAMNSYFRGQGLVALCACVMYCVGFEIVGLPLAIVMGLMVGVLYMIPYFQYVTLIPVGIICFVNSLGGEVSFWGLFGKCMLVYVVVQSVCDYVITPHVMGKEMGLNPAVILLSLSVWGSLLGVLGMIIALPATTLLMAYYDRYISSR